MELRSKIEEYEKSIYSVITVSWDSLTDNKFEFMDQMSVSTDIIDKWPYYEFEKYIKRLNEKNESAKKRQEQQEEGQQMPNMNGLSSLAKNFSPSNYKLPNFQSPF